MSKWWKPSRNGENNFKDIYIQYKNGLINSTEAAYLCGITVMGFYKRVKYYEKNNSCKYQQISKQEQNQAYSLMGKHIYKLNKYNGKYQDKLEDVLFRTCLYIVRNNDKIRNVENLINFSLKRKIRDIKYEEFHSKEIEYDDSKRH